MKKNLIKIVFLALTCITLSACASIFGEKNQSIILNSNPEGAKVTIFNKRGHRVFKGKTPTKFNLKKKDKFFEGQDYVVNFKKHKYQSHSVYLNRSYSSWYFANILNLGIGFFTLDPYSGAMWSYSPDRLEVKMEVETQDIID